MSNSLPLEPTSLSSRGLKRLLMNMLTNTAGSGHRVSQIPHQPYPLPSGDCWPTLGLEVPFPHLVAHSVPLSKSGWTPALPEPGCLPPQARRPCTSPLNDAVSTTWSCWWPREPMCTPRPEVVSSSPRTRAATSTLVSRAGGWVWRSRERWCRQAW